jgi:hypothetical protein
MLIRVKRRKRGKLDKNRVKKKLKGFDACLKT